MANPKTYKNDPDYFNDHAHKYALLGATNFEMAKFFGIAETTFETWLQNFPALRNAVDEGRDVADANVVNALYQRATGKWKQKAVKIMQYEGEPIITPYTERFAPDVAAIRYWLNNRQSRKWKDRVSNEHGGMDGDPEIKKVTRVEMVIVDPKAK